MPDWRGYLLAIFSVVFVANAYLSLFGRLRLDIKHERVEIARKEKGSSSASKTRYRTRKRPEAIWQ